MFFNKISLIFCLIYILLKSSECQPKGFEALKNFKSLRRGYQPPSNYKTTAAPTTTTAAPTTTYPSYPSSNSYGSSIQNMMGYTSGHNYQPLLVLLVPVPAATYQPPYTTTTTTTTTTAATTTVAEEYTTEEYGYEPIGSYK